MPSVFWMPSATYSVLLALISRSATRSESVAGLVLSPSTSVQLLPAFWLRHRPLRVAAYRSLVTGCTTIFCT